MKYLILLLLIAGCASSQKVLMKNCTKLHDNYYECENVPDRPRHERP